MDELCQDEDGGQGRADNHTHHLRPDNCRVSYSLATSAPWLTHQPIQVGVYRRGVRAQELSHVSFDGFRPKLARDRYAVVAIVDEVNVTHLIDIDGGQPLSIQGGSIDVFPPPFESFVARQKGTGEFTVLPHTAYDPIQRDVLQSPLATGQQAQPFSHLFEG